MDNSTIVEILLGVLSLVVGYGSYAGASRATKAHAVETQADVDGKAFERAKTIYESAIDALEGHIARLREQTALLDEEVAKLQRSNAELRTEVLELKIANSKLEAELNTIREGSAKP